MDLNQLIASLAIYVLPVLFAITLHEAAHGYVARYFGDMTAYAQGRISLNPLRHVELVGTIVVPLAILVLSGGRFLFGWAKPVPVNYSALRRPKRDMAFVALAGPVANLVMAIGWCVILKAADMLSATGLTVPLRLMAEAGVTVNLLFMALNLIPILPLDGGRVLASLLPPRMAQQYARLEPFGLPILLVLLATNGLAFLLGPVAGATDAIIRALVS
jgi:Zn-dependent protease